MEASVWRVGASVAGPELMRAGISLPSGPMT